MNDQVRTDAAAGATSALARRSPLSAARLRVATRRRLVFGAVIVLLLAALGVTWWSTRTGEAVRYVTTPVTQGTISRSVTATGTVNPVLTIIVGTYVSGVIQDVSCDYNTEVKKGQLCAKIDPRPYQSIVDQNNAVLATARAQLVKDEASLAYNKIAYDRDLVLLKRGIVSEDTLDSAKSAYDQSQAQVGLDQATIEQRQAELAAAQVNLGYTDIVSPVDGTVVLRNVTIGQTVAASFQTPTLFLIATDLTKMEVDTNVSESDIGGIKEGNKASFTVEAFPNTPFTGSVVQVRQAPQTVQNVVTFDVVVGVENRDLLLKPGMTATTRIITAQRDNVLRVPDQALRFAPGGVSAPSGGGEYAGPQKTQAAVWILENGRPKRVSITPGLDDDTYTEVVSGDVKPGDQVILGEQSGEAVAAGQGTQGPPPLRF